MLLAIVIVNLSTFYNKLIQINYSGNFENLTLFGLIVLVQASLRMFHDLGLVTKFRLDHDTMCHWLLTVKKNYRQEVSYHNWRHAFSVAQMMFISLLQSGWWECLGPVNCLGLLVACFSHDLDHRGVE
jgi:dual 3',5'-cyclic-AMP and -GMP phosphodiesterase 11